VTLEFSYYSDPLKKEKRGTIDLSKIVTVNPSPNKSKEHVFSLETSDRKYIFKAADTQTVRKYGWQSCWSCVQR